MSNAFEFSAIGLDGQAQEVVSFVEALQRLSLEATPPDLLRKKGR